MRIRLLALPLVLAGTGAIAQQGASDNISRATFLSGIDAEFTQMDTNKDKKVTAAELEAHRRTTMTRRHQERVQAMFRQLDADKNGNLSQQEFAQAAGPLPSINVQPFMSRIDANKDSNLSQTEYRNGAAADFDKLDTNKDGSLSGAEAAAAAGAAAPASSAPARAPEGR